MPFYVDEQKRRIQEWNGEGLVHDRIGPESVDALIRDLNQTLRARTLKGLVGLLAYQVMKRCSSFPRMSLSDFTPNINK